MNNLKKSNVFATANNGDSIREGSQGSICCDRNTVINDNIDNSRYYFSKDSSSHCHNHDDKSSCRHSSHSDNHSYCNNDDNQPNHCPVHPEPGNIFMSKRVGNTLYHVGVHFNPINPENKETLQDKILRLIKNDLNFSPLYAKMELPQTGRLLEGGSLL